jgi:MFS family permease
VTSTDPPAAASAPPSTAPGEGRFPGWLVVTSSFVVLTTSSGLGFYGLAVYLNAFSNEKGWDVASISLATTLFFLVGGVVGVFVARAIARWDARVVIVGGGVLGAAALAVLGQVDEPWQLYVVYAVFAVGWSASGLIPATTVVTRWFHVRRSVALSVASTGLSAGGILITPAAKWLLDDQGLAAGTPWLALVWFLGIVPVTLVLMRPDPIEMGWLPDGERLQVDQEAPPLTGVPFAEAVRSRFFVLFTIGYLLALGAQVGAIQQLVKLMEERTDRSGAALATLFLAGTSVVARLIGGRVASRLPMMPLAIGLVLGQMVAMILIAVLDQKWALFAAIILFGATIGNILMLQPLIVADRFGVLDYPRIFSRAQLVAVVGTAGGPLLLGWLHDNAGGYDTAYLVAAVASLVAASILAWAGAGDRLGATVSTS